MGTTLFPPIPADTARAVGAAFGKGHPVLGIADETPRLFADLDLEAVHATPDTVVRSFFQPALVTLMQFLEELPDRRAAEATRTRIDWKYLLRLPLHHPGLDHGMLCEFRRRLLLNAGERAVFGGVLERWNVGTLERWNVNERACLEAVRVLESVCRLSRMEMVVVSMARALDALAVYRGLPASSRGVGDWLGQSALAHPSLVHLYARYCRRLSDPLPAGGQEQAELLAEMEADVFALLQLAGLAGAAGESGMEEPAVAGSEMITLSSEIMGLRQVWAQNFRLEGGQARWRGEGCVSCYSKRENVPTFKR